MDEREAYIALNMMERIGPVGVRDLISVLGSATDIFSADIETLVRARGIGRDVARSIVEQRSVVDWSGEIERAEEIGARIITPVDAEYPPSLLEIHDPPLALYVKGALQTRDQRAIAVVGTRRVTHYGRMCAERVSSQLCRMGFTVVSGLALGVDTVAHETVLRDGGRTLAVMGSALDQVYPRDNVELAEKISRQGAVISEFCMGRRADKTTFPMRNRIVSGLSMGVVVVEAGERSGALITAKHAAEQGRSVFAFPGRIDSFVSRGTNRLIKDGARLIENAEDVVEEYEFLIPPEKSVPEMRKSPDLNEREKALMDLLEDGEKGVDGLIRDSGLNASTVNALLISLEMKKAIRMLPGRMVEQVACGAGSK